MPEGFRISRSFGKRYFIGVTMFKKSTPKETFTLLWTEIRRQIDEQRSTLESLRTRSIALLSVASLVAALFGVHVLPGAHRWWVNVAIGVALVAFGLNALLVVLLLMAKSDWRFSESLASYFEDIKKKRELPEDYVLRNLGKDSQASRVHNEAKLKGLHRLFNFACVFLAIHVIAWAVASL